MLGAIDPVQDPRWRELFFTANPDQETMKAFRQWLGSNKYQLLTLYHGTDDASARQILRQGLKPTSASRRRSLSSSSGYVYLSVFPSSAEDFGRMGNPTRKTVVFGVVVAVKNLKPDLDQINQKRYWSDGRAEFDKEDLAASLVIAHGARVKAKIPVNQLWIVKGDPAKD